MREIDKPLLSERTSIRLGGTAIAELVVENNDDLSCLADRIRQLGGIPVYIGRGSNIIALDGQLPIVLVRVESVQGRDISIYGVDEAGNTLVRAGAGVPLPRLLKFCMLNGLSGLEGLVGIPGTVGGAVAMNAGSFGCETGYCLRKVLVYASGCLEWLKSSELEKSYRQIKFIGVNGDPLILDVIFALTQAPKGVILSRMHLNFFEKKSRQPVTAWSAGCAFKNPPGASAGKLLDMAGFKGKSKGGMFFSPLHANFLINSGNGCANAALELMEEAREAVMKLFGINLEYEIKIIGGYGGAAARLLYIPDSSKTSHGFSHEKK